VKGDGDRRPAEFDEKRLGPLIRARRWDACRRLCEEAVASGEPSFEYLALRAGLRLKDGDPEGGWEDLLAAFALSTEYGAVYAEGEDEAARSRDTFPLSGLEFPEMEALLSREIRRRPGLAVAWAWRGLVRRRLLRYAEAASDLSEAHRLGLRTALVLTCRGEARLHGGDLGGLDDLEAAVRLPCAAWSWSWLGRALIAFKRDPRGLDAVSRAIALEPWNGWHRAWRAEGKRILGRKAGMYADYAASLRLDGAMRHSGFVRAWRGLALVSDRRWKSALSDFESSLEAMPGYALAVNGKARALQGLGRSRQWLEWLDQAVRLDQKYVYSQRSMPAPVAATLAAQAETVTKRHPREARAWRWLGFYRGLAGDAPGAEAAWARALALAPKDALTSAWRGQLRAEKNLPGAREDLRRAGRADVGARVWLAKLELAGGRPREALKLLDAAVAADPRFAWAFADRGRLRLMLGDAAGAAQDFRVAVGMNAGYAEGWADLAEALKATGDAAGSRAAAARARAVSPNQAVGRAAQWRAYFAKSRALAAP
jgi:tetratricopeptide (TPR) repeat protein